jgi:hypothetical protein
LWGLAQFTSGVDSVFPGVPGARYWTEVSTCPAEFTAHAPLLLLVQVQLMSQVYRSSYMGMQEERRDE